MSSFSPRTKSLSPLGSDEFRIEFEDDVLPAPVSRLNPPPRAMGDEEDFELQLARTQEELLNLQNQARVVERRKEELEEVTRKEREYTRGRAELHEKLSGKLVTLERASTETQRQLETLLQARDDISRHYRALTSIVIEDWHAFVSCDSSFQPPDAVKPEWTDLMECASRWSLMRRAWIMAACASAHVAASEEPLARKRRQ